LSAPKIHNEALSCLSVAATADPRGRKEPLPVAAVGMATGQAEEQLLLETTMSPSENDIRTFISFFQLLHSWDSSLQQSTPKSLAA
jgi:hypothetical protein